MIFKFLGDRADDRPVLLLANSLCASHEMWGPQLAAWSAHFQVVRFDYAGHGSHALVQHHTQAQALCSELLQALSAIGVTRFHYVGLSLGGMLGLQLAAQAPQRLQRLVIANCRTHQPEEAKAQWSQRIQAVHEGGIQAVIDATLQRWFTPAFHASQPRVVERTRTLMQGVSAAGYQAAATLVRDFDARSLLPQVGAATLAIAGSEDVAAPPEHMREVAQTLGASFLRLDRCAHLANVECAAPFTEAVLAFLRQG